MDKQEINRRMAEEVMGWKRPEMGNEEQRNTGWVTDLPVKENVIAESEWNPTEDLNQAMMGMEKLIARGCDDVELIYGSERVADGKWSAGFWYPGMDQKYSPRIGFVFDKSLPVAICLACLEAVEKMEKEN